MLFWKIFMQVAVIIFVAVLLGVGISNLASKRKE
jgi:hypothetical protein